MAATEIYTTEVVASDDQLREVVATIVARARSRPLSEPEAAFMKAAASFGRDDPAATIPDFKFEASRFQRNAWETSHWVVSQGDASLDVYDPTLVSQERISTQVSRNRDRNPKTQVRLTRWLLNADPMSNTTLSRFSVSTDINGRLVSGQLNSHHLGKGEIGVGKELFELTSDESGHIIAQEIHPTRRDQVAEIGSEINLALARIAQVLASVNLPE